jgi:hypothetical protein
MPGNLQRSKFAIENGKGLSGKNNQRIFHFKDGRRICKIIQHRSKQWLKNKALPGFKWLSVEGQDIVDKKMSHDIVDNAL